MDREQNQSKRPLTPEEIARLEAEAVAAARGEPPRPEAPAPGPAMPDFVPYVDDVPEPEPKAEDGGESPEDEEPYIPGKWERRIDALTPAQWTRWQIVGGAAVGLAALASLFVFGEELATYGLILAALMALLLPRYLERAWRRKLTVARRAMVVAMAVGLIAMGLVIGFQTGFQFRNPK